MTVSVLVIEDDFRVARIHGAFVDRVPGFATVGMAGTAAAALEAAQRLKPELILLDLYLPDVFGLDLVNRLRSAGVESDFIVISAANEAQTVQRALKLGIASYLLKPFTLDDLAARLREFGAGREQRGPHVFDDQVAVDRLFGRAERGLPSHLPKGMSAETAELIAQALANAEQELSAQQYADLVGIARVSARRYLEFFVTEGLAEVSLRYGGRGRPERLYQKRAR